MLSSSENGTDTRNIPGRTDGLRLNLCSGPDVVEGWINVDFFIGARLSRIPVFGWLAQKLRLMRATWPRSIFIHDIRKPLPSDSGSVDAIYSSHMIEHLTRDEGERFLRECYRVLRPGGNIRVVVPDLEGVVRKYLEGGISSLEFVDVLGVAPYEAGGRHVEEIAGAAGAVSAQVHVDTEGLLGQMKTANLSPVPKNPFVSALFDIERIELRHRTEGLVIAEAVKD